VASQRKSGRPLDKILSGTRTSSTAALLFPFVLSLFLPHGPVADCLESSGFGLVVVFFGPQST